MKTLTSYIRTVTILFIAIFLITCSDEKNKQAYQVLAQGDSNSSTLEVKEWPVPWEGTRPRDPYVAPGGKVWFCGQQGNYLAYFDPGFIGRLRRPYTVTVVTLV